MAAPHRRNGDVLESRAVAVKQEPVKVALLIGASYAAETALVVAVAAALFRTSWWQRYQAPEQ